MICHMTAASTKIVKLTADPDMLRLSVSRFDLGRHPVGSTVLAEIGFHWLFLNALRGIHPVAHNEGLLTEALENQA